MQVNNSEKNSELQQSIQHLSEYIQKEFWNLFEAHHEKTCLCSTTKTQISLHIRAAW